MFDGTELAQLAQNQHAVLDRLSKIEDVLCSRFYDMQSVIRGLVLAAATREPMLLVGPPGTGKSLLIRAFSELLGAPPAALAEADQPYYFEYLLTPFTEPGELFGYYDIRAFMQGGSARQVEGAAAQLTRMDTGMLQGAGVVYLDEVFNGSSAILNSLLAFTNERKFHDRGTLVEAQWQCIFAATNDIPETAELRAIYDRFTLRQRVTNVVVDRPEQLKPRLRDFLTKAWTETYADGSAAAAPARGRRRPEGLVNALQKFREAFQSRVSAEKGLRPLANDPFVDRIAYLAHQAQQLGLAEMSNRRLVRAVRLMVVHRVYRAVRDKEVAAQQTTLPKLSLGAPELLLIPDYLLDRHDAVVVEKLRTSARQA